MTRVVVLVCVADVGVVDFVSFRTQFAQKIASLEYPAKNAVLPSEHIAVFNELET